MIKGLTDQAPSLPRLGTLRKGAPKPEQGNRPGKDLEHFRFDSDDALACELFESRYGTQPRIIEVCLPFRTTDENFAAWREHWTASSLHHRCDGETTVLKLLPDGRTYDRTPQPCPGQCSQVGRLSVVIPALKRLALVTVLTTSKHDILAISTSLRAIEDMHGDLRGIPFILSRHPVEISTPSGKDGSRARREKWLIAIETAPTWVALQLEVMQRNALPGGQQHFKALSDHGIVDTGTGEIIDVPAGDDDETEAAPPPPRVKVKPETAIKRIRELWAQERALIDTVDESLRDVLMLDQNAESMQDLAALSVEELLSLGKQIRARVDRITADIEEVNETTAAAVPS